MGFETIEYELQDGVGVLRLNRPRCLDAHAGAPGLEQALLYEDRNQALSIAQVAR
jgi:hypothetical protein